MKCVALAAFLFSLVAPASSSFAADLVAPNANLKAEGIPPIPAELAARVPPYTEFKLLADNEGHGFARKANADCLFYAMIVFFNERLLK